MTLGARLFEIRFNPYFLSIDFIELDLCASIGLF